MAGLLTTPSLFLCPLQAIPVFRNLRHIKNFGRNSIAMLFLPKFCFLAILFSGNITHTIKNDGGPVREHIDVFYGGNAAQH